MVYECTYNSFTFIPQCMNRVQIRPANLQVYTDENDSISAVLTIKWLMTYTNSSIVYIYVYV